MYKFTYRVQIEVHIVASDIDHILEPIMEKLETVFPADPDLKWKANKITGVSYNDMKLVSVDIPLKELPPYRWQSTKKE